MRQEGIPKGQREESGLEGENYRVERDSRGHIEREKGGG